LLQRGKVEISLLFQSNSILIYSMGEYLSKPDHTKTTESGQDKSVSISYKTLG
jgi:hypothetical protein